MPIRLLPRFLLIGLLCAIAPLAASAALMQAPATESVAPVAEPIPHPDFARSQTTLDASHADQSICGSGALCQEWDHLGDNAQALLNARPAGPFGRMTFLANVALVGLGMLWAVLTRRSMRAAGNPSRRPAGQRSSAPVVQQRPQILAHDARLHR